MSEQYAGRKNRSLGLLSQIMYGMGEFFNGGAFVIINTFFTVFMTDAMGIPAALAGSVHLVGGIWDAITDPIMGNITDRTRSKLGPKRFYILIGAFASAITFAMLWVPVYSKSYIAMYLFYLMMYCLFSTGFTILMVPYNGLLPDMVDDYSVRSKFSNVRMIWSTLGSMVCGVVPSLMIKDTSKPGQYLTCAIVFGVLFLITSLVTFAGTWEKQKEPVRSNMKDSFTAAVSVYHSRAFRIFVGIYLTGQCGMDFVSGMAVYYVNNILGGNSENHYLTLLMAALIISQLAGMLIWGPVMAKTSKRTTILIGAPIRIISTLALLAVSHKGVSIIPVLALAMGIGIGNAATLTSIFAILADMSDVDELITGVSRPGTVGGMATFARKISSGVSAGTIGLLLSLVGYQGKLAEQSAGAIEGIKMIFIFAPIILCTLLLIFGWMFPMKKKEFDVVMREIARRKGEDKSVTTEEEKRICEKVTGLPYDRLWNKKNATIRGWK